MSPSMVRVGSKRGKKLYSLRGSPVRHDLAGSVPTSELIANIDHPPLMVDGTQEDWPDERGFTMSPHQAVTN